MAQFDVYQNRSRRSNERVPYLLDVQADLLSGLETRTVVPLARPDVTRGQVIERLTPLLKVDGDTLLMLTPEVAGVPKAALGPRVGSLEDQRHDIIGALDVLLTGV